MIDQVDEKLIQILCVTLDELIAKTGKKIDSVDIFEELRKWGIENPIAYGVIEEEFLAITTKPENVMEKLQKILANIHSMTDKKWNPTSKMHLRSTLYKIAQQLMSDILGKESTSNVLELGLRLSEHGFDITEEAKENLRLS